MKQPDWNDRFTIYLPKISCQRDCGSLLPVTPSSSMKRVELVERFGLYLKREEGYDFPLSFGSDPKVQQKGYFFLDGGELCVSTVQPVGAAVFVHEEGEWWLAWVWIHPYQRRHGVLSRAWPQFKKEFGDFKIQRPISSAMQAFLKKQEAVQIGGLKKEEAVAP